MGNELWAEIRDFTLPIKQYATEGEFDAAIRLSMDLTKMLREKKKQFKSSGGKK